MVCDHNKISYFSRWTVTWFIRIPCDVRNTLRWFSETEIPFYIEYREFRYFSVNFGIQYGFFAPFSVLKEVCKTVFLKFSWYFFVEIIPLGWKDMLEKLHFTYYKCSIWIQNIAITKKILASRLQSIIHLDLVSVVEYFRYIL